MIHRERCWVCRGTGTVKGPLYNEPCPICTPSPSAGSRITEEEADRLWNLPSSRGETKGDKP